MKLSATMLTASMATIAPTALFGQTLQNDVSSKILRQHLANEEIFEHQRRHLSEDNDEDENENEEESEEEENENGGGDGEDSYDDDMNEFLSKYSMKFVSCNPDGDTVNPETGDNEYGSVVVRMCESNSCSSKSKKGCTHHYGDIVVSAATFLTAYVEENNLGGNDGDDDDNLDFAEYTGCERYEPPNDGDDDDADGEGTYYYIGPACTSDGKDIRLAFFEDEYCSTESTSVKFSDVSGGMDLPYEDGGFISNECSTCLIQEQEENEDGEYEEYDAASDFCMDVYENAPYKCESKMEYVSYYGADESGCDVVKQEMKAASGGGSSKAAIFWIFFILLLCCAYGYTAWWRARKLQQLREAEGQIV